MMKRYKQLLTYIKSAVTRNYSEKSINSILDYISTSKQVSQLCVFHPLSQVGIEWRENKYLTCTFIHVAKEQIYRLIPSLQYILECLKKLSHEDFSLKNCYYNMICTVRVSLMLDNNLQESISEKDNSEPFLTHVHFPFESVNLTPILSYRWNCCRISMRQHQMP